jgi:hypothetical protein
MRLLLSMPCRRMRSCRRASSFIRRFLSRSGLTLRANSQLIGGIQSRRDRGFDVRGRAVHIIVRERIMARRGVVHSRGYDFDC